MTICPEYEIMRDACDDLPPSAERRDTPQDPDYVAPIVTAILGDDQKTFHKLIKQPHVHPDADYCEASFLCLAIMNKKRWAVEALCDQILVDLNRRSRALDQTPLQYAVAHAPDLAIYLLERQADPSLRDKHGNTILHLATKNADKDLVLAVLKTRKIDVLAKNDKGLTAYEMTDNSVIRDMLSKNPRVKMWLSKRSPDRADDFESLPKLSHKDLTKHLLKKWKEKEDKTTNEIKTFKSFKEYWGYDDLSLADTFNRAVSKYDRKPEKKLPLVPRTAKGFFWY